MWLLGEREAALLSQRRSCRVVHPDTYPQVWKGMWGILKNPANCGFLDLANFPERPLSGRSAAAMLAALFGEQGSVPAGWKNQSS
jgi:hypothetical protein